jgi:class 3 adenylate cyclase
MAENHDTLRRMLDLKTKELDLIQAIDQIRDAAVEPSAMLVAIVNALADHLQADLCLLCLLDRETGGLELKAVNEHRTYPYHFDSVTIRELAKKALQADRVTTWRGTEVSSALGLPRALDSLQLLSIPISLREEQLGVVLLARTQMPFDSSDVELLKAAETQIDSAVIQGYAYYELEQRNRELETIYRVDQIRDENLPFDDMLNAVLQELSEAIHAEMGFVMLYNPLGQKLEMRAVTHDDLFRVSPYYKVVDRVANEALEQAGLVCHNDLGDFIRSVMCIPLILKDEIIGVLGVVNRYGPRGFSSRDRRLLSAIGSQMDTAIFESLERRRLRRVLGRSVDPQVMEQLLKNPDVEFLKGERAVLTVLYADMRGSTSLAEHTQPELLVGFVNDFLGRMTDIILHNEATLDKFVGDEVMALFGAPVPHADHALRAVRVGLEMQAAHRVVMDKWRKRGVDATPIGVGIATGELIVGEMGCPQRTDYTVIGQAANLGSRICAVAEAGQVLISQETYALVKDDVEVMPISGLRFKGVESAITVYRVIGMR